MFGENNEKSHLRANSDVSYRVCDFRYRGIAEKFGSIKPEID
ncbi:hypothetical protein MKY19_06865 [Paenibacillus sp. FSL R5-0744]